MFKAIIRDDVSYQDIAEFYESDLQARRFIDHHFYAAKEWYENEGKNVLVLKNDDTNKILEIDGRKIQFAVRQENKGNN